MKENLAERFLLEGQYDKVFSAHGINVAGALRKAGIPEDIFSHKTPSVTGEQYFHFMEAIGRSISDPETPVRIATSDKIEFFSPPVFAAWCSRDARTCIERIEKYKRLIGPLKYYAMETQDGTFSVELAAAGERDIPRFLVEMEFAFLLHIIRSATKEHVTPLRLTMREPVHEASFENFTGRRVEKGEKNLIVFSERDMRLPFVSRNDAMWGYFEPELRRRLHDLDVDDSVSTRLRIALTELIPGGQCGVDDAAEKLGLSRRTLQRKLSGEGTTFQQQLNHVRELLAKHYLCNTDLTNGSIAYLLGYQELNSFTRAFNIWTGMTVGEYRKSRKTTGTHQDGEGFNDNDGTDGEQAGHTAR